MSDTQLYKCKYTNTQIQFGIWNPYYGWEINGSHTTDDYREVSDADDDEINGSHTTAAAQRMITERCFFTER